MSFDKISDRKTLPEIVADTIKESILSGALPPGAALPTEGELEAQFGVSRAVIRDAARMLKAQGLVNVQHGKGMFVSEDQLDSFSDALVSMLRREGASAWDVEQYEYLFLQQAFGLAASTAGDAELEVAYHLAEQYKQQFSLLSNGHGDEQHARQAFSDFMNAVYKASGNTMIEAIGKVLLNLRKWRTVTGDFDGDQTLVELEHAIIDGFCSALKSRDYAKASLEVAQLLSHSPELIDILKQTEAGTSPNIPAGLFLSAYSDRIKTRSTE